MANMDNLLESNERTLDIFDAVCSGLAECLALVHADIRQMVEHRDQLNCKLEHELAERSRISDTAYTETDLNYNNEENKVSSDKVAKAKELNDSKCEPASNTSQQSSDPTNVADDLLSDMKLLDKRLADSFSQALSMCNQQKSSFSSSSKKNHSIGSLNQSQRPSIFQVLLGKSKNDKRRDGRGAKLQKGIIEDEQQPAQNDTRAIINDINRQTRLAMQYSKQLEANLFKVEDLRDKYEMHLKMGLMVKNVSRVYLSSNPYSSSPLSTAASLHRHMNSPNSLGRTRGQHHSSTVVVNDHSSLGTRSSLSSLNLSTWSFSRRQPSERSSGSPKNSHEKYCCQIDYDDVVDGYNLSPVSSLACNQKCASTISLDSINKRSRQNSSKLISPNTVKQNRAKQTNSGGAQDFYDYPSQHHSTCQTIDCHQCELKHQGHCSSSHIYRPPPSPYQSDVARHPKQPYHYVNGTSPAEFATPTTTGTMASSSVVIGDSFHIGNGGARGLLSKSASNSSLKRASRNYYKSSLGSHSQSQLPNQGSKTTIREFIDNIERIEADFELYLGSFLLSIEDIQGFARVCQGDVFEINIKYGNSQSFKTKISVLKDNRQKCDHKQSVFKARIADVIAIKAYECKGLGKKVLLGHKLCDTRDLFTARSQLMTISLNQTGSIKLNLIITWNPLHMTP
jgi:hypothetical protein